MEPRELGSVPPYRPRTNDDDSDETDRLLRLRNNENPLGPSPRAVEAVRADAARMHRYPARPHAALDEALAAHWDVDTEQIWLGAGAVSVIDTLTRAMVEPGEAILRPDPGFSYFGRSNRSHYGTDRTYRLDREAGFEFDPDEVLDAYEGEPLVYINTPHNPTGATASHESIVSVATATDDDTLVVVDEAYDRFTSEPSSVELVDSTGSVAVVRTFSKAYGLAGARIGYGIVPASIAPAYERVSTPFGVDRLACTAGLAALADEAYLERSVAVARQGRAYLADAIEAPTWPSEANFVLVEVGDAPTVVDRLEGAGLAVKDCTSFGLPDCIRITVGTPEQNRLAANIVNRVVS